MVAMPPAWVLEVMSLYDPEELARFYAIWEPPKCPPVQQALSHEERLRRRAEMHAKWAAEDEAEMLASRAKRTPEAVCRGYAGRDTTSAALTEAVSRQDLLQPGDHMQATRGWLHHHLGCVHGFERIHFAEELKDGHCREVWRAAAGSLVTRPRGQIGEPAAYLLSAVSSIAAGSGRDIRGKVGYFASDTWPDGLILFAGVAVPKRGNPDLLDR